MKELRNAKSCSETKNGPYYERAKEVNMEEKLKALAVWLKNYRTNNYDTYTEGVLEAQLRENKNATIQQIGDYLEEILEMDSEQIKNELK